MPRGTETILLAEDHEDIREISATVLRRLGYDVIDIADPGEARESALRREGKIDLLLTDLVMPGMTGTELADSLRGSCAGMKVLFMSGYADLPRVEQRISERGFGYLLKPFSPAELAKRVRGILDQR